jgi:leader peptidase (prepilin peptidase) / N-methyltransferase
VPGFSLLVVYAALLGLICGSFLNVVVHRLPRGSSVVRPRSACPWCGGAIAARDNVPLVSYLLLRGRCRRCGGPISPRYPLLEAATALLFVLSLLRFGAGDQGWIAALFCWLLLALGAIDAEHLLLPDALTLPGILAGLALQPWLPATSLLDAVLGALGGAGLLILGMNFWYWWRGEEGMGMGDVNMLAMIGAFLGWQGAVVALFAATVSGAVVGLAMMALGRSGLRTKLPFGTFLALGGAIALFWGPALLASYRRLL